MSKNATTKEIQPTTRGRMATRVVATSALLCALSVVFARFTTVMPSAISRFSIEAVPIALAGYFFGPIAGLMVGAVSDTVGCRGLAGAGAIRHVWAGKALLRNGLTGDGLGAAL